MAIQKLAISEFLALARQIPVLDVRSPAEYQQAHIPGAISFPLFSDEERKQVGTNYKQKSRETAIKTGLDYFGPKMRPMVEQAEEIIKSAAGNRDQMTAGAGEKAGHSLLVHCWRGGMRSAAVAWLLDLYGFRVFTLVGGYKAYRKWVLDQFEKEYRFTILGGYTGSGKTLLIDELKKINRPVIDLEALANHKGSAFGGLGPQPRQEMFENMLAEALFEQAAASKTAPGTEGLEGAPIWLEDESQRIGNLQIPMPLWGTMRQSPVCFLDIPFEERLQYITAEYKNLPKEKLVNAVIRIQKRLGGLDTKNAVGLLVEDNYTEAFRILLRYYDKWYGKALFNRENISSILNKIPCQSVDTAVNIQKLLSCVSVSASL